MAKITNTTKFLSYIYEAVIKGTDFQMADSHMLGDTRVVITSKDGKSVLTVSIDRVEQTL